ncbi:MAG TPA: glutamate--tRNA ligase [Flavobacteriales bacterium]|nr:glutamate--tRNA ligase [Flavobacteriales bacterium]
MSERKTRVRFAPSPTGPLHMGGVRTALYNYLYAKSQGGDFILRIEDTDKTRYVEGAEEYIVEALEWCGLKFDEGPHVGGDYGPYRQSERKSLYREYANQLVGDGYAYYAFDTPEELDEMRERLKAAKVAVPQYNAVTRSTMTNSLTLSDDEVEKRLENGDPYVIRIKVPRKEEIRVQDIIRGWVVVHSSKVDDKVLFKSDGMPTYHLANVVDDYLMKITHVIRGEEWLPSTPIHVLLYKYLGWEEAMPQFAHLPLLLRPDGNGKLSKRDGDRLGFPVFPMDWIDPGSGEKSSGYKEQGYFTEAFINMLAFLGWNPGTTEELFSLDNLVQSFTLERVGKAGAKFDLEKAHWYNQRYLRDKSDTDLAVLLQPHLAEAGISSDIDYIAKVCNLMKERATFISDMVEGSYFFNAPKQYDEKMIRKKWKDNTPSMIQGFRDKLSSIGDFSSANIDIEFKAYLESNDISMGEIMPILRILIAGVTSGPSILDVISVIGKQESLNRIEVGLEKIPTLSID